MGVNVETHERTEGELYVFVLNGLGETYSVMFTEEESEAAGVRLAYVLIPENDWTVDDFQETMEARDEAFSYVRTELEESIADTCMSMKQIVPQEFWEHVGADVELIEDATSEMMPVTGESGEEPAESPEN